MSSRRRRRLLLRGVVLTSELQLILIIVIAVALMASFGMMTSTLRQVSSAKVTVSLVRAEALMVSSNTLAITLWLQNSGDTSVTITLVGFSGVNAGTTVSGSTAPAVTVTVNPGETVVFSVAVRASSGTVDIGMPVYVFVRYQGGDKSGEVGTVVRVIQP